MTQEIISGIYKITTPSGKFYIGSSINIFKRWREHKWQLKTNRHHSPLLQKVWDKYKDKLKFEVILICIPEHLLLYEQIAIDSLKPEYNICKIAGSTLGRKLTTEHKAKISAYSSKKKLSPEHIAALVASRKGKKSSVETREKIRQAKLGTKVSEEVKLKLREASAKRILTPELRQIFSEAGKKARHNDKLNKEKMVG